MKRIIAFTLAILLAVITLLPTTVHAENVQDDYITGLLLAAKLDFPEGEVCTTGTEKYHIQIRCPGLLLNCSACWGFCFRFLTTAFHVDPTKNVSLTWQNINAHLSGRPAFEEPYTSPADLRPGDILAWTGPSHAAVVMENHPERSVVVLAEGNYGGRVHYGREVSYNNISSKLAYIVRFASSHIPGGERGTQQENSLRFEDVKKNKYYYASVQWALENGITAGTDETHFSPDQVCTREQVMTFLWRTCGGPTPTQQQNPYTDVSAAKYYYHAILWATSLGVTSGTGNLIFGVGEECTRAQVVTFLWRIAGSPAPDDASCPFEDVPDNKYYSDAVLWAVQNGITCGKDKTLFCPNDTCTRAEIVTFIYYAFRKIS